MKMNFKDMLSKMSQLSEAVKDTGKGKIHTAEPGGYGRKDDEDDEGNKVKADAPKKGRGRPKKDADSSGEVKKYDFSAFGVKHGKDIKLPAHDKKKTTKHSIKEYFDQIDASREKMYEAEQIQIKPAAQMPKKPGQTSMPGQQQQVAGQPAQNTQVIAQGNKTLGTVNNPQLANQIKQSIGKGEMTLMPDGQMDEAGYSATAARAGKDIGKPGKNFAKIEKSAGGGEKGQRIAGAVLAKLRSKTNEADIPTDQNDVGANLGAGRNQGVLEAKKGVNPFAKKDAKKKPVAAKNKKPDDDNDGVPNWADKKPGKDDNEGKKKGAAPKKGVNPFAKKDQKKKVKEGMEQSLQAARLSGKSHGLKGHSHCGKNYEDMEEARMYHEGYKEGLDECYGQGVYEQAPAMPPATPGGMANQAMEADMDEGNAFTAALARTPKGGKFSVGGKSFTDRTSYDSTFESLDSQLNALLEGKVDEGMTVSISKGQQGSPDSVTVSAQDGEADQLLSIIKQAGLGLFGGDENNGYGVPQDSGITHDHDGIEVVDDHDGMMALMKKLTGQGGDEGGSEDYADEEGHDDEHGHEGTCESCGGMMEAGHSCDEGQEMVDEVESYDQEIEIAAEANAPDSGAAETTADENAEAGEDKALAIADAGQDEEEGAEDSAQAEEVNEWANDAGEKARDFDDESFKTDMDFMTKVISGGLNKEKATGQSTVPVVSTQISRLGNPMQESINLLHDWKKLSGIR
jgi:hypothetical protein